jgi:hypothetical protein
MQQQQQHEGPFSGYSPNEPMPLAGYATLVGAWSAGVAGFMAVFARRLPKRTSWSDYALLGIATHKLARIVTKDWVTSPLRAPFVRYQRSLGGGEVEEKPRGQGLRRAIGDLLTCNFCIAPWIAAALAAGFVVQPRATRFLATLFGVVTISDVLQHLYSAEKKLAQ